MYACKNDGCRSKNLYIIFSIFIIIFLNGGGGFPFLSSSLSLLSLDPVTRYSDILILAISRPIKIINFSHLRNIETETGVLHPVIYNIAAPSLNVVIRPAKSYHVVEYNEVTYSFQHHISS